MTDETVDPTAKKKSREHSGARIITEQGDVKEYQPRAEHSVLRNGSRATDLIQTSIPRWKTWVGHVFDIVKLLIGAWIVLVWMLKPHAVEWIKVIIAEHDKEVLEQLAADSSRMTAHEKWMADHLLEVRDMKNKYADREELDRRLAEIQRQILAMRRDTERIK